ncbi:MAG: B12-binding domain-containing protein [Planctomycetota bacterium]
MTLKNQKRGNRPHLRIADYDADTNEEINEQKPTADIGKLSDTPLFQHYAEALLAGDRPACRELVDKASECGVDPKRILLELCWPAMESIRELYKEGKISLAAEHMATRLNRAVVDRLTGQLPIAESNDRRVMVICGDAQGEELGGQITADLFESEGYEVKFLGGGIPADEANHLAGLWRADLIILFATLPSEMPAARQLIDKLRDHGTNPELQVMCCGGIFKRAPGLGEEIGADLVAVDAGDATQVAADNRGKKATAIQQTVGRNRRNRVAKEKRAEIAARRARKAA